MTRREVRAITLAKLMPMRGALLWDVGAGCGSVSVEWMRGARYARAVGIEPRADRRAMAAANALALGVPGLRLVEGEAPAALNGLDRPDAVFVGGGLGRTPMIGRKVRDFLPEEDLLAYSEAILRVYNMFGRRDNKYKARIKILMHETKLEELTRMIEAEWEEVKDGALIKIK